MIHSHKMHWSTRLIIGVLFSLLLLLLFLLFTREGHLPWVEEFFQEKLSGTPTPTLEIEIVPTSTAPAFAPGTPLVTAIGMTSIHSSPSEESEVLAILEPGRQARILGMNANETWWAIEVPYLTSGSGWVIGERVLAENTLQVRVVSEKDLGPAESEATGIAKAVVNVNIRSGPGMNFQKVGTLELDQEASILGVDPDNFWFLVEIPGSSGNQGWISVDYVVTRNADNLPVVYYQPDNASLDIPTPGPDEPSLAALAVVNIRTGPDTTYEIVGKLQVGQRAAVIGISKDGRWYAIKYTPGASGRAWVAAEYVEVKNVENVAVLP